MLVTALQIEVEAVLLKNVGIKKKRRRFVAGVVEGRVLENRSQNDVCV